MEAAAPVSVFAVTVPRTHFPSVIRQPVSSHLPSSLSSSSAARLSSRALAPLRLSLSPSRLVLPAPLPLPSQQRRGYVKCSSTNGGGDSSDFSSSPNESEGNTPLAHGENIRGDSFPSRSPSGNPSPDAESQEWEREDELLRALGLDASIPETATEFLEKVSSRAYEMRRRLEATLDTTSYDVVEANPWRDSSKPVFALARADDKLYTMRTRTPRSEVEREFDLLFGRNKSGREVAAGGKDKSQGSAGRAAPAPAATSPAPTKPPSPSRFSMTVEDVREGVLVFEDE